MTPPSEPWKKEPHRPVTVRVLPYPICARCGLVYLHNDFTQWSIEKGCTADEHPAFGSAKRRFTRHNGPPIS